MEWQIGYDLKDNEDNQNQTLLNNYHFVNYRRERKIPYELAEILFYSQDRNLIGIDAIRTVYNQIAETEQTIDAMDEMQPSTTDPQQTNINGIHFFKMQRRYPMLVHRFGQYEIYAEIIIKEKQRAVGIQPMLYVCLPITSLTFNSPVLGRTLTENECAKWVIGEEEAQLSLELFRIFGILSQKDKIDTTRIFEALFDL